MWRFGSRAHSASIRRDMLIGRTCSPGPCPCTASEVGVVSARTRAMIALPLVCLLALPAGAQAPAANEPVDYDAIYRIKEEGFQRSQVMDIVSYLTDVYGPRLTGSPNIKQAAEWTVKKLGEWGASNPRMENWGTFGRGWVNERFSAQVLTPTPWPIIGMPKAWTPGLSSPTTADVVYAPMESEKDFDAWKGRLKGKIVLPMPTREVKAQFEAPGQAVHGQGPAGAGTDRARRGRRTAPFRSRTLPVLPQTDGIPDQRGRAGHVRAGSRRWRHPLRPAGRRVQLGAPVGAVQHVVSRQRAAADRDCRRALRPSRAHARPESAGDRRAHGAEPVHRRSARVQRARGVAGHRQGR